jgi:hypothetical protein
MINNIIKILALGGMIFNVIKGNFQMAIFFGICVLLLKVSEK